jgi:D-lactate dehydrogenase (cytochrome)
MTLLNAQYAAPPEAYARIDAFAAGHSGPASLPAWSVFLREAFHIDLSLDADIVNSCLTDSSNLPARAEALARPATAAHAALILHACAKAGIPVTLSGGRSNLTGSASAEGGLILSFARMLLPEPAVNEADRTVLAPVGMILEDLRNRVLLEADRRLFFPVDPTSRADATVGGCLACNASGFIPGEAGAVRRWVRELDVLTPDGFLVRATRGQYVSENGLFELRRPDGTVVSIPVPRYARPAIKNASGPWSAPDGRLDFLDLIIGSEGIFGVVTQAVLQLDPSPRDRLDLFLSLPSESAALALRAALAERAPGGLAGLSALEYFGVNCRRFMNHESTLFHGTDPVAVYIQAPLPDRLAADAAEEWLALLEKAACGVNLDAVMLLDNERDRALFMDARHSMPAHAVELVQRRGTFTLMTDTVVPPARFADFLEDAHALIRRETLDYLTFGHLGDCHLHITLLPEKDQVAAAAAVYDRIVDLSAARGGVYSGEHGTGKRKRADFLKCYGPGAAEQIRRCKAALDPLFLLNRGNVVEPEGERPREPHG